MLLASGCAGLLGSHHSPAPALAPAASPSWSAIPSTGSLGEVERREGVLRFARAQLGKPYCWGGAGPGCYDCSGLVSSAWREAGVIVPRTSEAMSRELREVPLLEARAGDILHWPGHVGLYAGEGLVIDAGATRQLIAERRMWGVPRVLRPVVDEAHS